MSDYRAKVQELLTTARGRGDGDVALLQEAANLADLLGDPALGIRVRIRLISAANWSGNYEQVIVAFSWCLAKIDQLPEQLAGHERSLLWYYKWVQNSLCEYSQVSREQIETSFIDMEKRYLRAGLGMQPIDQCRAYVYIRLGDIEAHRAARSRLVLSGRSAGSDCLACQTNDAVHFDLETGDLAAAVQTAGPILEGRQACTEVPCITYGMLLLPLLKLGRMDEADKIQLQGNRQARSGRDMVITASEHCAYLALAGKFSRAISIFETAIVWFYDVKRTWERMMFLQSAMVLFEQLAAGRDKPIKLRIPESAAFFNADSSYVPSTVLRSMKQTHDGLLAEMNRRNGNDYLSQRHQRFRELVAAAAT